MKVFIILSLVFTTVFCELNEEFIARFLETLNSYMNECASEAGATKENFEHIIQLELSSRVDNCLLACVNKKYGFQDKEGKITKANALGVIKFIEAEDKEVYAKLYEIFDKCSDIEMKSEDECDITYEFVLCYKEEKLKRGMRSDVIPM